MSASAPLRWIGILLALGAVACSGEEAQLQVQTSPGFAPGRVTAVSMLGVFQDGRMSAEAWSKVRAPVSSALGGTACEALYAEALHEDDPSLFADIDASTQAEGITEDLLERIAPRAGGELIVTVSVHSKSRSAPRTAPARRPRPAGVQPAPGPPHHRPARTGTRHPLELVASVYSVQERRSVARMSILYPGVTVEDAIRRFAAELAKFLPGAKCSPWREKSP